MKYTLTFLLFIIGLSIHARSLRAVVDSKQFHTKEGKEYLELYFQFLAQSIHFQGDSVQGTFAEIETQLVVNQEDKIVAFDKFVSKTFFNPGEVADDIYGLKRFELNPGVYRIEFQFIDLGNKKDTLVFEQEFEVLQWNTQPVFGDILLLESLSKSTSQTAFTRNQFEMIPKLVPYFNVESSRLLAYTELYNANLYEDLPKIAIRHYITSSSTDKMLNDYTVTKIYPNGEIIPLLINFNIEDLPTGSYNLVVEFLDLDETVLQKRSLAFDRFNPTLQDLTTDYSKTIVDPRFFESLPDDSVFFFLESLIPIASRADQSQIYLIIDGKDLEQAKKYFQAFWISTDPLQPTDAWIKYKQSVMAIEKEYGSILMPGFRTDRGRVFLQYGPPSAKIQRPNEPGEYPYEIWQYYKIGNFSNRRFVFFNALGVGNEYVLLHSDLPGELFNNRWLLDLSRTGVPVRTRVNDEGILEGGQN